MSKQHEMKAALEICNKQKRSKAQTECIATFQEFFCCFVAIMAVFGILYMIAFGFYALKLWLTE